MWRAEIRSKLTGQVFEGSTHKERQVAAATLVEGFHRLDAPDNGLRVADYEGRVAHVPDVTWTLHVDGLAVGPVRDNYWLAARDAVLEGFAFYTRPNGHVHVDMVDHFKAEIVRDPPQR